MDQKIEAWTKPELLERWWAPKSFPIKLRSCETDVRVGGRYRLVFGYEGSTMEFFGRYLEVTPSSRLVWTNDEGDQGGTVTTVTFEETGGRTHVTVHDLYPSKEALDDRLRVDVRDARIARATGRASRQSRRERGSVVKASIGRAAKDLDGLGRQPLDLGDGPRSARRDRSRASGCGRAPVDGLRPVTAS